MDWVALQVVPIQIEGYYLFPTISCCCLDIKQPKRTRIRVVEKEKRGGDRQIYIFFSLSLSLLHTYDICLSLEVVAEMGTNFDFAFMRPLILFPWIFLFISLSWFSGFHSPLVSNTREKTGSANHVDITLLLLFFEQSAFFCIPGFLWAWEIIWGFLEFVWGVIPCMISSWHENKSDGFSLDWVLLLQGFKWSMNAIGEKTELGLLLYPSMFHFVWVS